MSKRRLWTLENNLSFALFSSFSSQKRRRDVLRREISLSFPRSQSLSKCEQINLQLCFDRASVCFRVQEREIIIMMMMAKQYFRFSFTPSLFLSLSVSLCKRLCRCDCAGKNALLLISHQTLSNTSRHANEMMRDAKRNNSRDIPRNVKNEKGGHFYHSERKTNDKYDRYETMRRKVYS